MRAYFIYFLWPLYEFEIDVKFLDGDASSYISFPFSFSHFSLCLDRPCVQGTTGTWMRDKRSFSFYNFAKQQNEHHHRWHHNIENCLINQNYSMILILRRIQDPVDTLTGGERSKLMPNFQKYIRYFTRILIIYPATLQF